MPPRRFTFFVVPLLAGFAMCSAIENPAYADTFTVVYAEKCSICHGENLEGTTLGFPLTGREFTHGDTIDAISKSIADGFEESGMPAFSATLSKLQIKGLALHIVEQRTDQATGDFKVNTPFVIPDGIVESEKHNFRLETVIDHIDPLPFSIAPMPDGRILLTEKTRGLSIISVDGNQSELIQGTPKAYNDGLIIPDISLTMGTGWMMDVDLHPDFEENGWIYIYFGDRCSDCNDASRKSGRPVSMNKLVRGRIKDGKWLDEETIWQVDTEMYTTQFDMAAGGRIAFDEAGHVFLSVGFKGPLTYTGIQDLSQPYGKIHRVYDDGRIPEDNPYVGDPKAMDSVWSYGHRSQQGLEYDAKTEQLWSTEMGPRGGDELNLLRPAENYGWPLYSKGLNYDGTPVEYGKRLGIEFDLDDIVQPVVDWTPSPAVSSFIIYEGSEFPGWHRNLIVGTLKAREIYRLELKNNEVIHTETLLSGLARVRDIETGADGNIYILLEHGSGGKILRIVPAQ